MRRTDRAVGLAVALVIAATSGCGTPDGPSETSSAVTSRPDTTATSSPDDTTATTPSPTQAEPEDAGQQAAAEAVVEFWAMVDELSQDPEAPVQDIAQVAQGQAAVQWVSNIQTQREDDLLQTGDTEVTVTDVETVEDGKRYEVTACLDWSDVVFNGEKPDRGDLGDVRQATYVVRYDELADRFFVAEDPLEYVACDG